MLRTSSRPFRKARDRSARPSTQIFDRKGQPLYYREFQRQVAASKDEHKLMYGFLFSLKKLVGSFSPKKCVLHAHAHAPPSLRMTRLRAAWAASQGRRLLCVQHRQIQAALL